MRPWRATARNDVAIVPPGRPKVPPSAILAECRPPMPGEITRILASLQGGDPEAVGAVFPLVYDELRRIARSRMRAERPGHTLSPTALVHWFFPCGGLYYWKTTTLPSLDETTIETMSTAVDRPSSGTGVGLWPLGGAVGRIGSTNAAYGRRGAPFLVSIDSGWPDPEENDRQIQWTRDTHRTISSLSNGELYLHHGFRKERRDVEGRLRRELRPPRGDSRTGTTR